MAWRWPNIAASTGVYNFNAIDFGNYYNTVPKTKIESSQISKIGKLSETVDLSLHGDTKNYDVLTNMFLTAKAGDNSTNKVEISVFHHTPQYTADYVNWSTKIGTYVGSGHIWTVAIGQGGTSAPTLLFMPTDTRDVLSATIDLKGMLDYLVTQGVLTGNEFFNGFGMGAEVRQGSGSLTINAFSVDYKVGSSAPVTAPPVTQAPVPTQAPAPTPDAGTGTLVVRVSGDSYKGDPHFQVLVDGHQVGDILTATASHAAGKTQDITLTGQFDTGAHDVTVRFLDDLYGGTAATDRNLYVHQVSLNGQTLAGSAATNHAGYNSGGVANMFSAGTAEFHTAAIATATPPAASVPSQTSSDTFVFRVSGDSYKGDPHFKVLVDGHQVGGTLTTSASHAAGQTQDITLTGEFGAGAHDVTVQFLDDLYGGTATTDRNLYVHQVSLNGQTLAGSAANNHAGYNSGGVANMFSNGTAEFHTAATTPATTLAASVLAQTSSDTFVFRVSADSYKGDPHFLVLVDGHQVGGTLTTSASHAAGQTQDITLTGRFGAGTHDVTVQFLDDLYGGTAATDRNLYVHQVSLNGHTLAGDMASNHAGYNSGGVANMFSTGSADFYL